MSIPKQETYSMKFSPWYCSILVLRLAPYLLYHLSRSPYRHDVAAIGYIRPPVSHRRRIRDAAFDAVCNVLLDGYTELSGRRLHPSTGQVLTFLAAFMGAFDRHFEERLGQGESLDLSIMLALPLVQEKLQVFQQYLNLFGRMETVIERLHRFFNENYNSYVDTLRKVRYELCFEDVLHAVHLDSGLERCLWIDIARLFNGHPPCEEAQQDFYHFGIAGKFADDMVDLVRDLDHGSPNLLYALLKQDAPELATVEQAISQRERLNARWWSEHCKHTNLLYFEHIERHYNQIRSAKLRLACDLTVLPAIIGYDYDAVRWETR